MTDQCNAQAGHSMCVELPESGCSKAVVFLKLNTHAELSSRSPQVFAMEHLHVVIGGDQHDMMCFTNKSMLCRETTFLTCAHPSAPAPTLFIRCTQNPPFPPAEFSLSSCILTSLARFICVPPPPSHPFSPRQAAPL